MLQRFTTAAQSLLFREDGQTLVEYALIMVMVSIAAVSILAAIGTFSPAVFSKINADF